jgi:hypothetical protein
MIIKISRFFDKALFNLKFVKFYFKSIIKINKSK